MNKKIAVFCGSNFISSKTKPLNLLLEDEATALGTEIIKNNDTLLFGGDDTGYMGLISRTVYQNKGSVIGYIPKAYASNAANTNKYQLNIVNSYEERRDKLIQEADAFIAFPGGIGTLDELTNVIAKTQAGELNKPIGILNIGHFFDPFISQLVDMTAYEFISTNTRNHIHIHFSSQLLLYMLNLYIERTK